MGVKKIVADRLDKARSFAENVRAVYEDAYKKALDVKQRGIEGIVKDIEPRLKGVLDEGLQSAQTALDNINQSLADKAIPAFRKRAVSQEKLDYKAKKVVKEVVVKDEPVRKKRVVKKTTAANKNNTSNTSRKTASVKK